MSNPCGEKACSQCGERKPLSAFAVRKASRDGLSAYCRSCGKARYYTPEKKADGRRRRGETAIAYVPKAETRRLAAERREQRAQASASRVSSPPKPRQGSQAWYSSVSSAEADAYRRRVAAMARQRYAANLPKARAKVKRWKRAHPETVARQHAERANREDANSDRSITRPLKAKLLASATHCGYCGVRLDPRHTHLDHRIPLAQGGPHALSNLVVCCTTCNLSKGARTPEQWWAATAPRAA